MAHFGQLRLVAVRHLLEVLIETACLYNFEVPRVVEFAAEYDVILDCARHDEWVLLCVRDFLLKMLPELERSLRLDQHLAKDCKQ